MPTPFSHLAITQRLLTNPELPTLQLALLEAHLPAYLLGSVVADARIDALDSRAATHFYTYTEPLKNHPWRVMIERNPTLMSPLDDVHRAFIAGYVAHLAADEVWSLEMLEPHFARGTWGKDVRTRFFWLHLLLISMDERDQKSLPHWHAPTLLQCQPNAWLPFMNDGILCGWRDFIAQQLTEESQTLAIFGGRIGRTPLELRPMLDDEHLMQEQLWQHITPAILEGVEDRIATFALSQLRLYLDETS